MTCLCWARSASPTLADHTDRADAEDKLRLVELLLKSEDLASCAQEAVEWLVAHGAATQALCLAVVHLVPIGPPRHGVFRM